jgi:hypothetical protein
MTSITFIKCEQHSLQERPANLFVKALACDNYDRKHAFSVSPRSKEL